MDKGALPFGSSSRAEPPRVRTDPNEKKFSGPSERAIQLKIFTLNLTINPEG